MRTWAWSELNQWPEKKILLMVTPDILRVISQYWLARRQWTVDLVRRQFRSVTSVFCLSETAFLTASAWTALLVEWLRRPLLKRKLDSRLRCNFFSCESSHSSDLEIGTPVATLPGAWHYRVSAGTGWHGVIILWLGDVHRLICNFYLSVTARKLVWAYPSLRYTSIVLGR